MEERVRKEEEPPAEDDPLGGGEGEDDAMEAGPERVDQGGGGARILRDGDSTSTRGDGTEGGATHVGRTPGSSIPTARRGALDREGARPLPGAIAGSSGPM